MLRSSFVFAVGALLVAGAVSAAPPTTHYRSIGDRADYGTVEVEGPGTTVTAVNGETYVIGSLDAQWKTANRGRGDRISIAGTPYTILSVDAENELTLTQPYAEPTTFSAPYTISRKFQKLKGLGRLYRGGRRLPGRDRPRPPDRRSHRSRRRLQGFAVSHEHSR